MRAGANLDGPKILGTDPETGKAVTLRNGPYGLYVQLGERRGQGASPSAQSLLEGHDAGRASRSEKALALLSLPRELGPHPETGEPILAGIGRFGPYVKHGTKYKSIPADESVLEIGMNRAVALLAEAKAAGPRPRRRSRSAWSATIPATAAPIELYDGRYGIYVKHGGINATVPRDLKPEELTVEQAVSLLAERAAKGGKKPKPVRAKKKPPVAGQRFRRDARSRPPRRRRRPSARRRPKSETPPRTGTDG